jgi:beta-lactamase class A
MRANPVLAVGTIGLAFIIDIDAKPPSAEVRSSQGGRPTLATELARIAAEAPGRLGVRVLKPESGAGTGVNADDWFPMMSVYKLPIAIHALRLAERGHLDLDATVTLTADDRRPGVSRLGSLIEEHGEQQRRVRDLVSAVLRDSDNTASDKLLKLAGGPSAVERTLRSLGIDGIDVSRYELEFAADYYGVCCEHKARPFSLERFVAAVGRVPAANRRRAAEAFTRDRRDAARPSAIAALLTRLQQGALLNNGHTARVLEDMADMHNQDGRLRAGLPPGTRVSLRPGTSGDTEGVRAACNDNAIIELPDGGHLIIAAFLGRRSIAGSSARWTATVTGG